MTEAETVFQTLPASVTAPDAVTDVTDEQAQATPGVAASELANDTAEAEPSSEVASRPPTPTDLDIARRFEAIKQADVRARRLKLSVKEAEQRILDADRREAEVARREAAIQSVEDKLRDSPLEWADERKVDPDILAKRYLKPLSPEEKRIRDLEIKYETRDREEREAKEKAASEATALSHKQEMHAFIRQIIPEECPHLTALYDAYDVPRLVERAINLHGAAFLEEYGRNPTNAELRGYLESEAKARALRLSPGQVAPGSEPGNGVSGQASIGSGPPASSGPHTLTNQHAAQAASAKSPRVETLEERRAKLVAQLEAEAREAANG